VAHSTSAATPDFALRSPLLSSAYELARCAYEEDDSANGEELEHSVAVGRLLSEAGFDQEIVAAGLLHDLVEDTSIEPGQIDDRFGSEIAALVREMTENEAIEDYRERKAEHRGRVAGNYSVAVIYAADKLANTRAKDGAKMPGDQLDHYLETLRTLCASNPELPFLGPLREELERLQAERAGG
jgi:(p)ppGpp synthase/HD superfamily hydrolase